MSGHSKWHSIRHKKAKEDAKRGKIFTKLIREIQVAARLGGPDLEANPRLRQAVAAAKAANMPAENIERAIKKGAGADEADAYEEVTFEGYGPAGVAILVQVMTDNRNRTVAEIRHLLDRHNGKMGESGCVAWMFEKKGLLLVEKDKASEDQVMEVALEAGAEDVRESDDNYEVLTSPEDFEAVKKAFEQAGIPLLAAEISMLPQTTVKLSGKDAAQMLKLMEALEDHDDVQHVYANFDIPAEEMERLSA